MIATILVCVVYVTTAHATTCLNALQRIGTHNSYHLRAPQEVLAFLTNPSLSSVLGNQVPGGEGLQSWNISLPSLATQLTAGMGALELDLFPDTPLGGAYRYSAALKALGGNGTINNPDLLQPGIKVMHVTDADFRSSCTLLSDCLQQMRNWSDARQGRHLPITVYLELKGPQATVASLFNDPRVASALAPLVSLLSRGPPPTAFTTAVPWDFAALEELQATIADVFDADQILLPEDVEGNATSLAAAVLNKPQCAWPAVEKSLGKFAFVLITTPDSRTPLDTYAAAVRNGTLEQLMFVEQQGTPVGNMNVYAEAPGDAPSVAASSNTTVSLAAARAVQQGMLVRGFAGPIPTSSAIDALLQSGIQHIASDLTPGDGADGTALREALVQRGFVPECMARCNPAVLQGDALRACDAALKALCRSLVSV